MRRPTLDLQRASNSGLTQFRASQIALTPGAKHLVVPNWLALDADTLTLNVDSDGDGTTDETFTLDNEAAKPTTTQDLPEESPSDIQLKPNYPNPFTDQTQIQFGLPERNLATLKIFDVAGRHVDTLVDVVLPAGWHEAPSMDRNLPAVSTSLNFVQAKPQ